MDRNKELLAQLEAKEKALAEEKDRLSKLNSDLKDRSDKEAEGDIMTHYVAVEASLPVSGILSEMVETWGKDIFNISEQKYSKNPTNVQVQSSEYDELFIKASKDRVEFFKNKVKNGEVTYKPYTSESSSQKPLAIKAVFKLVADKKN
jgi:hypothetical protein